MTIRTKNVSLEACDLGKGAGVVKGAYAELPRHFSDSDRVMDLETRLVHCMATLQGTSFGDATKRVFGAGTNRSDLESLPHGMTRDYLVYLREKMGAAADELEDFDIAYRRTDWSRYSHLPAFEAANRRNAYHTFIRMQGGDK